MHKFLYSSLITLLLFAGNAFAAESIDSMQEKIDAFISGPDHFFAPITSSRARDYLAAARLAGEQGNSKDMQHGLEKSLSALTEAKNNAANFQKKHQDLLQLRQAAQQTISFTPPSDQPPQPDPKALLLTAEAMLTQAIEAHEAGQLNITSQTISKAKQAYIIALQAGLPFLIDETGTAMSKALGARAKKYAPQSYQSGKQELAKVQQYSDGLIDEIPLHPAYALSLLKHALNIATQAKTLRKDAYNYETLLLAAQHDRVKIATSLGMAVDPYDATFDVSIDALAQALQSLQAKNQQQQQAHTQEIATLKQQHQISIIQATDALRASLSSNQHDQLRSMKDAFRAKLDRETFDQRRQKQVRDLFKKGEVELLINLDGSVLLRLIALKFSTNSSKIGRKHYPLLSRVKTALETYGDRKIRIEGHTDSIGDAKPNQKLSLKRAESVRDFLIAADTKVSKLTARGWGESFPIATNDYKQGRAKNRRIDIIIQAAEN